MKAVIIILLILLVFLLSCDSPLLQSVKNKFNSAVFHSEEEEYNIDDELTLIGDSANAEMGCVEPFMNSRESTNTWEPSTSDFGKLSNDKIFKSYSEDLNANVDMAIVESHREYTEDTDFLATTGASHASARDDFMPAVPFHGLPRKAHYANLGAESSARTAQSETPEVVLDIKNHNSTGYSL
jgi:hypothetical protein